VARSVAKLGYSLEQAEVDPCYLQPLLLDVPEPTDGEIEHGLSTMPGCPFEEWLIQVEGTGISELQGFAAGLESDKQVVMAALTLPYSNGHVEGQINCLKFIKRSMCGRAGFDLLRKRVLAA
jgi:hypothetical protein